MSVYEQAKQAVQEVLASELQALKAEIRRLDERVESLRNELLAEIRGMDERLKSTKAELLAEIRRVEGRIDALDEKVEGLKHEVRTVLEIRERLAVVEAKVGITRS